MARTDRAGAGDGRGNLYDDITNKIIVELEKSGCLGSSPEG